MTREEALSIICRNEPELRKLGAERLLVFGSTARGTAAEDSDVDVAVDFVPSITGFARLGAMDRIRDRLTHLLGRSVDVVETNPRSARLRQALEQDSIRAF